MFPKHWSLSRIIIHAFCEMLTNQKLIRKDQEKIMSALDDTKAALAAVTTKVGTLSTDLNAFIEKNSGGATDADLVSITAGLGAIGTAVDAMEAVVNPPAPAPPTT